MYDSGFLFFLPSAPGPSGFIVGFIVLLPDRKKERKEILLLGKAPKINSRRGGEVLQATFRLSFIRCSIKFQFLAFGKK